ncbi:DUF2076 domain-containing protein [Pseudomonas sp. LRF_L74]|uniref:DUF2076 domain-containing protein n=1 Tax=Pseudomonas sp. LRF_L74 TaxID=3369422 RepID=UPI003F5E078F
MNSEEQALIDDLFSRLRDAERQSTPRDAEAEARIAQHLAGQAFAPYYMAQALLVQEEEIRHLDKRIQLLEVQVAQQYQERSSTNGFLAGLFGDGKWPLLSAGRSSSAAGESRDTRFMTSALRSATGDMGGVMPANEVAPLVSQEQPLADAPLPVEAVHGKDIFAGMEEIDTDAFDSSDFLEDDTAIR